MVRRSLQASVQGIELLKKAMNQRHEGQTDLAGAVDCSRQTIWSLLHGNPIDSEIFMKFCTRLGQNWEEIAESDENAAIDALVQMVRNHVHGDIQERCGTMRVLDMTQPISLNAIYTTVNIFEAVTGHQRRSIANLLQGCDLEELISLGQVREEQVPGPEAVKRHSKLMILGKPGAGKTTFLKWIAIQCNNGQSRAEQVPIFITLKAFAEAKGQPDLLVYIQSQWADCGVKDEQAAERLLRQGRVLILLDELDEVREVDHDRVLQEIQDFPTRFRTCRFVITCRVAAREYTFERFTEVEVTDFDDLQIKDFVTKWFEAKQDSVKTECFLNKLRANSRIRELATNPLLLALLCLVFQESADFPTNRSELYKEGLDVLLKKWDTERHIRRDVLHQRSEIYQSLTLQRKEALLSQVAFTTFERGDIFFKQQVLEQQIADFICNLSNISDDSGSLELDSEAVLKSIEVQHGLLVERARGIYSFSHLTFQEYFTAKRIASSPATQALEALTDLVPHITEKRWREVFLITAGMLQSADALLLMLKAHIDKLVADSEKIQQFLIWLNERVGSIEVPFKPAAARSLNSYYAIAIAIASTSDLDNVIALARALNMSLDSASTLDSTLSSTLNRDLDIDRTLDRALNQALNQALDRTLDIDRTLDRVLDRASAIAIDRASSIDIGSNGDSIIAFALARSLASTLGRAADRTIDRTIDRDRTIDLILAKTSDSKLKQSLQTLKDQLPVQKGDPRFFSQWWKDHGRDWVEQFRSVVIQHRNFGHDWQFSQAQAALLAQYYTANKLLVDCLNSDCHVTCSVREEIEATLLLPKNLLPHIEK